MSTITAAAYPYTSRFEAILGSAAPFMSNTVTKARETFGDDWSRAFEETLAGLFADEEAMRDAIVGYVRFALEATKLQRRFERERQYIAKTYAEAASEVYHNRDYMHRLYLPGILLSHYVWPHHYRQLSYFHERFMPHIAASQEPRFYDVGVGSGFYSRQVLTACERASGVAFDISDHSRSYAIAQVNAFGASNRWRCDLRDVITDPPDEPSPFLLSVEVLEHLEDPVLFLKSLRRMLRPGGLAFITAALTAPNADHIYLYNDCDQIVGQLAEAGFSVLDYKEERGYEPKRDEPVPRIAAFIVQ